MKGLDELWRAFCIIAAPGKIATYRAPIGRGGGCKKYKKSAAPGGPEGGGGRYQHFAEIVGALRAQNFRSEIVHIGDTDFSVCMNAKLCAI
jgi:hypothetical protein